MATESENRKSQVEHAYDIVADQYLAWTKQRPTPARAGLVADLLERLPAGADVLELGCGAGVPCTQALIEHGLNVTGNDISATQIALARKHVPQATLIHGDMFALDFAPASFDAVLAFYSIFHLAREEQVLMIAKITGWLKLGGWILCNFQEEEGDITWEAWFNFEPAVTTFTSGLGIEATSAVLRRQGFQLVVNEVMIDKVDFKTAGKAEERFHWVMAQKEDRF